MEAEQLSPTEEPADTELHEEPEMFVCPIEECGKSFEKFTSLRAHALRSHRTRLELIDGRVEITGGKEAEGKPPRAKAKKEAEPVIISTQADQLKDILKSVKYDKIDACLKLTDTYGYDLLSIYQSLTELGAARSIIRPVIAFWSARTNEPIPKRIASELSLMPMQRRDWHTRSLYERGYPPSEEDFRQGGTILHGMANVIRALKESEGAKQDPNLMYKLGAIEKQLEQSKSTPVVMESPVVGELQKQVSELTKKLDDEREKRQEERFKRLEDKIEEAKRSSEKDALTAAINRGADVLEIVAKGLTVGITANPPPEREKVKSSEEAPTIYDLVPKEYQE